MWLVLYVCFFMAYTHRVRGYCRSTTRKDSSGNYMYGCDAGQFCKCGGGYCGSDSSANLFCVSCTAGYYCKGKLSSYPVRRRYANTIPQVPCPKGMYSTGGAAECTACPAGTYTETTQSTTCQGKCQAGYSCPINSTTERNCTLCGVGRAALPGAGCLFCKAGKYAYTLGMSACLSCPAGFYNSAVGMTECAECGAGTYSSSGTSACSDCGVGKYSASRGAPSCRSCPAGTYASTMGRTECAVCEAGTYSSGGSTTCSDCAAGKYSTFHASICRDCPPGSFAMSQGQSMCELCPAGTYTDQPGSTSCIRCTSDHFSVSGATSCETCDA